MENSADNIDARLARFEENSFGESKDYDECYSSNKNCKNVGNQHFIYDKRQYRGKELRRGFVNDGFHESPDRSHPVSYNAPRYQPKVNINFEKEEIGIMDTDFRKTDRHVREDYLNLDSQYASHFHKNVNLEVPYKVHNFSPSNYDNFGEVDHDMQFRNNRNIEIFGNSAVVREQNEDLLRYSRYNDFKKSKNVPTKSDFRVIPKDEKSRITKLEKSTPSYASYSGANNIKLKHDVWEKRNKMEDNDFELLSHQSNGHKVIEIHDVGFTSCHEITSDFPDVRLKKENRCVNLNKKKLNIDNPAIYNEDSEINQIYCEDIRYDFHSKYKSGMRLLNDEAESIISASEYSENIESTDANNDKFRIDDGKEEMSNKFEKVSVDIRRRKRKSNANTLTMHDAQKIAPLVLENITDENYFQRSENFISDPVECVSRIRRKCWAKQCWSNTKHSHGINISKDLHDWKNRGAIVNSLQSPQYSAQSKKSTCADCWSSFLKASSSRLQLWNSTLKKIEGQFGTGVVSYFVFLRWLIFLNFVIFILYFLLIILPYSAFALLPARSVKAPNTTIFTEEFLEQFPKYENEPSSKKRISFENISLNLDEDLLGNLGTLLDNYVPDEILDITARYSKRNQTDEERTKLSLYCKERYEKEMANYTKAPLRFLQDFLQGTGWLESTILFLGFYPDRDVSYFGLSYNFPIAFLAVLIVSFFLSLILMLQYSSHGIEENILTQKSNYLTFSNILFCSWDYCIEDKKTADIRHKSITCEIKSNLAEEHRKSEISRWSSEKKMKVYTLRVIINMFVIAALFGCFYLIYKVVNIQLEKLRQNALKDSGPYTLYIQFLPPLVITGLNIIMPIIFSLAVKLEMYSTRTQVNIALFRIVFLRLASVFVLVSSLYQQLTCEPKDECRAGKSEFCRTPICWETYVGQQLYKLVITDFLVYICMFLAYDLPRDFIVQRCKCKVTQVVGRQVFDIPSQVLSLVYSQTLCWLGLFYSPILPGISVLKFLIIFYIKKLVVLKHCAPSPVLYKASRTNSIFMTILMLSLFVVTTIHGYCLTSIEPSPGCSPFRRYDKMMRAISDAIDDWSSTFGSFMKYLFSVFFFIPAFLLLILIIYYYWTVVVAHRKMTKVLKAQIAVEGRDKQFLLNRLAEAARQITAN